LLSQARVLAEPIKGKAINLRVTPVAIEFDLFCAPAADTGLFKEAFKALGDLVTCKRLDLPPVVSELQETVNEARRFFNDHRFWEVHEVLEGLWLKRSGMEKQLLQGLILMAAALVHAQKDEIPVMWTMIAEALKRLEDQPPEYHGWNIAKLRDHFARVLKTKKLEIPTV